MFYFLIQADNLLNLRNLTKEEKRMYDEMTRQQDHYWASLTYAQEEGRAEGMRLGIEQGRMKELVDLVKEGLLTREIVAKKLKLSEEELEAYL